MSTMRLTVLGATGTIGVNTLELAARHPDQVEVYALSAYSGVESLLEQCREHRPRYAAVVEPQAAQELAATLRREALPTEVLSGVDELCDLAGDTNADCVMAGIVGMAGMMPTLAAVKAGRRVLLASKEALVAGGRVFMDAVRKYDCTLLPVDSEHNAVFQCLAGAEMNDIESVVLTASGGPFREMPLQELEQVTPEQAIAHPNWRMGPKISVDSATMINKGLELIEAVWLFDLEPSQINVLIHPQSLVHALVTLRDGSTLAHLGPPDMRVAIAHALFHPQRCTTGVSALELAQCSPLTWMPPEPGRYPCLELVRQVLETGGKAPIVLNAANEIAVEGFLQERIRFTQIPVVVEETLSGDCGPEAQDIQEVIVADEQARVRAHAIMEAL